MVYENLLTGMSCGSNPQQAQSYACTSCIVAISHFQRACKDCSLQHREDQEGGFHIPDMIGSNAKELDNPNRSFACTQHNLPSDTLTIGRMHLTRPAYKPKK